MMMFIAMFLLAVLSISLSRFSTFAQEEGDLRTISQRLETFNNGKWGTVCSRDFDDVDASVACKQLGYRKGTSLGNAAFGGKGAIWKSYLKCNGTENKLMDCKDRGPSYNCSHSEDVGIDCFNETPRSGDVRLISGRLEIFYNGIWGTVCDDSFDDIDAQVACRQLGYNNGIFLGSTKTSEYGKTWLDEVECSGSEQTLGYCKHNNWGVENCFPDENVKIECKNASEGDLRISLGKLEILHKNTWGTVCSGTFDETEAQVACKQLGYRNGSVLEKTVTTGTSIVWLDTIKCNGGENKLTDCSHPEWGTHSCSHGNVVGIRCCEGEGDVRIVSGRLEIYYYGTWGTICDDNFDDRDATVACRQLGYNSGKFVGAKENGTGPIWLDDIHCSGNEPTLGNCSNSGLGEVDCVHRQDVGIVCSDSKEGATRINSNKYELTESMEESGRLEIFHNNEWGSFCKDDFEKTDAEVACRQLGYKYGNVNSIGYGYDTGKIWLTKVHCNGDERNLALCQHAEWGENNCTYNVKITCSNETSDEGTSILEGLPDWFLSVSLFMLVTEMVVLTVMVARCSYVQGKRSIQNTGSIVEKDCGDRAFAFLVGDSNARINRVSQNIAFAVHKQERRTNESSPSDERTVVNPESEV